MNVTANDPTIKSIFDLFTLEEKIQVMDVGASVIAEVPVYKHLLDRDLAHLNAFEGDERHIAKLQETYGSKASVFPDFLFDGSLQTLYLALPQSGMTSLFKPNASALNFFNGFGVFGEVERTESVQTKRLDEVAALPAIDLVKMDIQGAELTVLQHGTAKLQDCLAVQLEVSWICLYEGQPGFGEVDVWMRSQGFVPHCFLDVKRWSIAPTVFNNNFRNPGNQLLESDIVYVKDPLHFERLSVLQLKKLACIAHYCFKSIDLCVFVLLELEKRQVLPENSHSGYLANIKAYL